MKSKLAIRPALGEVFRIYREFAAPLFTVAALIFVPIMLLTELVAADNRDTAAGLFLAMWGSATFIYAGVVTPLSETDQVGGGRPSIGSLWGDAAPSVAPLILTGVLYTLGTTLGTILLIVPGLVLITFWSVAPATVRIETLGPISALGRSWSLVRGRAWSVFAVVITVLAAAFLISTAVPAVVFAIAGEETATFVGSWLGLVLALPLVGVLPSVLYRRLAEYDAEGEQEERSDEEKSEIEFTDVGEGDRRR